MIDLARACSAVAAAFGRRLARGRPLRWPERATCSCRVRARAYFGTSRPRCPAYRRASARPACPEPHDRLMVAHRRVLPPRRVVRSATSPTPRRGEPRLRPLHSHQLHRRARSSRGHAPRRQAERTGLCGRHPDERVRRTAHLSRRLPRTVQHCQQRSLLELVLRVRPAGQCWRAGHHRRHHPRGHARSRRRSDPRVRRRVFRRWRHDRRDGRDLPRPLRGGRGALRDRLPRRTRRRLSLRGDANRRHARRQPVHSH